VSEPEQIEAPAAAPPDPEGGSLAATVAGLCPFLVAEGGRWRALEPSRDHRCTAVAGADAVPVEIQRRRCLRPEHVTCSAYLAARANEAAAPAPAGRRRFVATTPVVVERARRGLGGGPSLPVGRALRIGGVVVVAVAVVAFAAARWPFGSAGIAGASPSPMATPTASSRPSPSATPLATALASPTPAQTPAATRTPRPARSPRPTAVATRTYTVRPGDTLSGIAAKFGTTVEAIARLNGITNTRIIRSGQVLKIP
jgi:nucleoid-associated protein YgaU